MIYLEKKTEMIVKKSENTFIFLKLEAIVNLTSFSKIIFRDIYAVLLLKLFIKSYFRADIY